jgi:hypothetical protein
MTPRPSSDGDPEVLAALRDLPRETAGPGFTAAVLEKSAPAREPAHAIGWSRPALALAASVVLLTVVAAGALERAHQKRELRGRVDALRTEHQELEQELAALKRLSTQEPSVVYLGGDDQVDVVLSIDPAAPIKSAPGTAPVNVSIGNSL